eukprot:2973024-Alexandrium_andersonii.AAC.2
MAGRLTFDDSPKHHVSRGPQRANNGAWDDGAHGNGGPAEPARQQRQAEGGAKSRHRSPQPHSVRPHTDKAPTR